MIVLASCQDVAEEPAPRDTAALAPGYPSLHTVPPRPQLSYTIEQRRAIVDGLIADRENARYSSDVVRYRAGLSSLPPPAAPAFAAVPVAPEPEAPDAADAITPPVAARDAPVVSPETEFLYEDDDLGSFMEEMIESPGPAGGGPGGEPEANAAPLGTRVIRASALRSISPGTAYPGRAPVVTLAMPPAAASLPAPAPVEAALAGRPPGVVWGMPDMSPPPAEPNPPATATPSRGPQRAAPPPPTPVETTLAGRAPGVVWGMPDMSPPPAEPEMAALEAPEHEQWHASSPAPAPVETALAGRAPGVIWGMPDMSPAQAAPTPVASPRAAQDAIAVARAAPLPALAKSGVESTEWNMAADTADPVRRAHEPRRAMPPAPAPVKPAPPGPRETVLAMADTPTEPPAKANARSPGATSATAAAPPPAPAKPALDSNEATIARSATALADRPMPQPQPKPVADAAGIELAGGLVTIEAASSHGRAAAFGSVPFNPQSAMLTPDAAARLAQFLAETEAPVARIKVVGEAAAPALALDRALAVGLALVQSGVPADRLELTLARGGSGDQARLFLAAPTL